MKRFDIGYHAKVMFSGFLNALYGAATAGLIGMSIYGFIAIPSEGGYIAVSDFIGSVLTLILAIVCMHIWGKGVCKKSKCVKRGDAIERKQVTSNT